ncbi:MAG: T9SS type A sorting domain-containing protein [Lewinellaceae bacterium]|nr:T9SS type A sorting domain-containing protein [Lewinellaceae bacterium]
MKSLSTLAFLLACSGIFAQSGPALWADIPKENLAAEGSRPVVPVSFRALRLDTVSLAHILSQAPHEKDTPPSQSAAVLSVAMPGGQTTHYRIVAYDMMEPALAARFPEERTFRGVEVGNARNTIHLDWGYNGFHAMARRPEGTLLIDPYAQGNHSAYISYYKHDYPTSGAPFFCQVEEGEKWSGSPEQRVAGDCQLRSYRLAVATTAEYSNYHGGTAPLVQAAVVTAINRVNEVYFNDFGITLVLIGNNDLLYYFNAGTDPYTNNNGSVMLNQNQANIDNVIGSANYDIGHVFSTGGGGIAQLSVPCTGSKARGVTGLSAPIGDPFYIDYVAHEMGHQFGANHTQNNDCNRVLSTSMEPGSASTIMGYAGVCAPNIQSHSDDYFHAVSIQEISSFITAGAGNNCPTITNPPNSQPVVTAAGPFTIPHSTPFRLTASGSDADNDPLTYCWEQWDPEVGAVMPPLSTNDQGPLFRSLLPSSSPTRYFPNLTGLLANTSPTWEVLPSVGRDMEFRVTVRDNHSSGGCTDEQNVSVTVEGSAGPFLVTAPNTNVLWLEGQQYLVSWNVANTTLPPVSCANVDILLSYDGGNSYPVALASGIANNGAAYVTIPSGTSSTARLMVACSDNIFFDLSNSNFRISAGSADYSLGAQPARISTCPNTDAVYTINVGAFSGYSSLVNLSVSGAPAGTSVNLSSSAVVPGNTATLTISNLQNAAAGSYTITVNASSVSGNKSISLPLDILVAPSSIGLSSPADATTDVALAPTLSWVADAYADYYELELALDAGFNTVVSNPTPVGASWTSSAALGSSTTYYWRVRGISDCGDGPWSSAYSFETVPCVNFTSTDVPKNISPSGSNTVNSTIAIADMGTVQDVNVLNISGTHSWMADLTFYLIGPDNTQRILANQLCTDTDNFNISFDSESSNTYGSIPCSPMGQGGTYQPSQSLTAYNGKAMNGTWTLRVSDGYNFDGGQLQAWSLRVCPSGYQSALPVELVLFEARAEAPYIRLYWQTASEADNAGFEVQRRVEGEKAYTPIGWVAGQGDSRAPEDYEYLDREAPRGLNCYYRLRQLDYDGREGYSPVRSARLGFSDGSLSLWPNPTTGALHIRIGDSGPAVVRLFTASGQAVLEERMEDGQARLDLSRLPAGVYTVQAVSGRRAWQERVVLE